MRVIQLGAIALVAVGCSGDKKGEMTPPAAAAATPAPPAASASGPVVEVRMTGDGAKKAAFEPSTLTIAPGTTVRFINVSGGPHNISFWSDSVPAGGAAALAKGMPDPLTDLTSTFLTKPGDHYDVSFAGAPAGVYKGYCQPHLVLGMRVKISVK
jgi:plastocyanin